MQLGSPTVQLSTFPPPPLCAEAVVLDSAAAAMGMAAAADGIFRIITNPSTGFELKANLVRSQPTAPFASALDSFSLVVRVFSCRRFRPLGLCPAKGCAREADRAQSRQGELPARRPAGERAALQGEGSSSTQRIPRPAPSHQNLSGFRPDYDIDSSYEAASV